MTLRSRTIRGPDGRATLVKELLSDWGDWETNGPRAERGAAGPSPNSETTTRPNQSLEILFLSGHAVNDNPLCTL